VKREKILTCIDAARRAPSAENTQPWRFIIMDDPDEKEAFGNVVFSGMYRATRWALKAPVLLVLLAEVNVIVHRAAKVIQTVPYHYLDVGIAGEHFVLQAQALGLGTCWIGWFNVKKAKRFLELPAKVEVIELMAVGYPSPDWHPKPRRRRAVEEIVHFNRWGRSVDSNTGRANLGEEGVKDE
jgi:nitroreductase